MTCKLPPVYERRLFSSGTGGTLAPQRSHLTSLINFSFGTTCLRPHFGHRLVNISSVVFAAVSAIIHIKIGLIAILSVPRRE